MNLPTHSTTCLATLVTYLELLGSAGDPRALPTCRHAKKASRATTADLTDKRPLSGVRTHVSGQVVIRRKAMSTDLTHKRSLSGVCPDVPSQLAGFLEADNARRADVSLGPRHGVRSPPRQRPSQAQLA